MNTPRILFFLLLAACIACAQAQDNAAAPAQAEMQKWIATTDGQWQAVFKRDVTDVHEAELNKVKLQYLTSLETAIAKASGASDLNGAVALRNEQKRFGDTNVFPEKDDAADAASVKQIRTAIRLQLAKLEKDTAARAKALHAKYDAVLAQAQTQLTQRQRLDDALLVKTKRDEIAAAWLTGIPAAPAPEPVAEQPKPQGSAPGTKPGGDSIERFFVNKTWQNSNGTSWSFKNNGTGTRTYKEAKSAFTWKVTADGLVETNGKIPGEGTMQKLVFKFVSLNESYFGKSPLDVQDKLTLIE